MESEKETYAEKVHVVETNHQYTYVVIKQIKNEKLILKHASMYVITSRYYILIEVFLYVMSKARKYFLCKFTLFKSHCTTHLIQKKISLKHKIT